MHYQGTGSGAGVLFQVLSFSVHAVNKGRPGLGRGVPTSTVPLVLVIPIQLSLVEKLLEASKKQNYFFNVFGRPHWSCGGQQY